MLNFNSLPYLCQQRFAEIVEAKTLKKFSSLNSDTKILCKNRKIVQNFEFSPSITEFKDSDSVLLSNNFKDLQKWKSIEIINEFKISFKNLEIETEEEEADSEVVYRFEDFKMIPRSYKKLDLSNVIFENIYDLTELIGDNLVEFSFLPKFFTWKFSSNWEEELNELFSALDKVKVVRLLLGFNRDETKIEFKKCDKIINKWQEQRKKIKNTFWQISWRHGQNSMSGKIYRRTGYPKSGSPSYVPNGRTSLNLNNLLEAWRFHSNIQMIHIDKMM